MVNNSIATIMICHVVGLHQQSKPPTCQTTPMHFLFMFPRNMNSHLVTNAQITNIPTNVFPYATSSENFSPLFSTIWQDHPKIQKHPTWGSRRCSVCPPSEFDSALGGICDFLWYTSLSFVYSNCPPVFILLVASPWNNNIKPNEHTS